MVQPIPLHFDSVAPKRHSDHWIAAAIAILGRAAPLPPGWKCSCGALRGPGRFLELLDPTRKRSTTFSQEGDLLNRKASETSPNQENQAQHSPANPITVPLGNLLRRLFQTIQLQYHYANLFQRRKPPTGLKQNTYSGIRVCIVINVGTPPALAG